ncbi:MAG: hypothetical protein ACREDR_26620 [Blastocatellia bacterium]
MKFTKPISREVEISGITFIVTLDEAGASFRLKGKRRSAQIDWAKILDHSTGEAGETASEYLGLSKVSHSKIISESPAAVEEEGSEPLSESAMSASATSATAES